jgi:hypothetical protein
MSAATVQHMADRVAALIEERLRVRGQGLAEKVKRAGRTLPRKVREAAMRLADAAMMAQNPKLLVQLDEERVAADYDLCLRHLSGISTGDRWLGWLINFGATTVVTLIFVGLMLLGVLYWRGLL